MTVCIIAAIAETMVIGRDNALPWHLPDDLRRFKRLTMGHTLLMGRRTYESIGRPLPGRRSIVLTRRPAYGASGIATAASLEAALALAVDAERIFVIGGAEVFRIAMPVTRRLFLTRIHATIAGDVTFPPITTADWRLVEETHHEADARHEYAFSFCDYERR